MDTTKPYRNAWLPLFLAAEQVEYPGTTTRAVIPKELEAVTVKALDELKAEVGDVEDFVASQFGDHFLR